MKAWRVHRYGTPTEALSLDEVDVPEPGPGELRIAGRASVLNWNDIDGCHGRYETVKPELPYVLGEAAQAGRDSFQRDFDSRFTSLIDAAKAAGRLDTTVPSDILARNLFAIWQLPMRRLTSGSITYDEMLDQIETSVRVALLGIIPEG